MFQTLVSNENGDPFPAAKCRYTLPRIEEAEQCQANGGGEGSVFTNLAKESEGQAAETESPACTTEEHVCVNH